MKEGARDYPPYKGETKTCYQVPPVPPAGMSQTGGVISVSCLTPQTPTLKGLPVAF